MLISSSKLYELALSSIKERHINDFLEKYIPGILPILTEYGGRFLINGSIQHSVTMKFPARAFALLEWPSIDQFIAINKDERMRPLLELRNQYLDFILEGCFYGVSKDRDFEIPEKRAMRLLLSDRSILHNRGIRFQWINDARNSRLSSNLYFFSDLTEHYDKDVEEFSVLIR